MLLYGKSRRGQEFCTREKNWVLFMSPCPNNCSIRGGNFIITIIAIHGVHNEIPLFFILDVWFCRGRIVWKNKMYNRNWYIPCDLTQTDGADLIWRSSEKRSIGEEQLRGDGFLKQSRANLLAPSIAFHRTVQTYSIPILELLKSPPPPSRLSHLPKRELSDKHSRKHLSIHSSLSEIHLSSCDFLIENGRKGRRSRSSYWHQSQYHFLVRSCVAKRSRRDHSKRTREPHNTVLHGIYWHGEVGRRCR